MPSNSNDIRTQNMNLSSVMRDVWQQRVTIVLLSITIGLLACMASYFMYHPTYTAHSVMFVTVPGITNVNQEISQSTQAAPMFTEILNSNVLQNKVAKEIGLDQFVGSASVKNVSNTNLLEISVTTSSPETSYREIQSIMNNYDKVSDYVLDKVILQTLEQPKIPDRPDVSFRMGRSVTRFSVIALIALAALFGFLSYSRDTIRVDRDVDDKLDTKLLMSIPHENKYKTIKSRIQKKKTGLLVTDPGTSFAYSEAMDRLARRVQTQMANRNDKVLLVASVTENEGKTTVAANVALELSMQGYCVVLIDGDMRKPAQYKLFGMQDQEFTGLSKLLHDPEHANNIVHSIQGTNLLCIFNRPSGTSYDVSSVFRPLNNLVNVMREYADYIIIDTPPTSVVSDAEVLLDLADASLLVVHQHKVEAKNINDAIDILNGDDMKLLGCVLNDVYASSLLDTGWGTSYYSRYGKYGKYGKYGYGKA